MKHAVITGAANGIGEALARRFVRAGYAVTGVDVDVEGRPGWSGNRGCGLLLPI